MMVVLRAMLSAILSLAVLFLLTKLIGARQISQLTLFDYINGITIGSIAAEMAGNPGENTVERITAMAVYGFVVFLLSKLANRSIKMRHLISGKSIILYSNGCLHRQNFIRAHMDLNEFLMQCRLAGYFDLGHLETIVFEPNGAISFLPKEGVRPATPQDFGQSPPQRQIVTNVILDGAVMRENLCLVGKTEMWLLSELKKFGYAGPRDIFLGLYTSQGELSLYPKSTDQPQSCRID